MIQLVRQHGAYIIAVIAGFVAVPVLYHINAWELLASHLIKAVFLGGVGTILVMGWMLRKDYPHRTTWVAAEIVLIGLMLPVVGGSGVMLHDSYTAWRGEAAHWHADYRVIVDGETVDLVDPHRFCDGGRIMCMIGNHTGTQDVHEHNDQRIHVHGPISRPADATLGAFFDAVGGELTADRLRFPTNDGMVNLTNTGGKTVKVLVKTGEGAARSWELVDSPAQYRIAPYTEGPTDTVFIIRDGTSADEALESVRRDNTYRGVSAP